MAIVPAAVVQFDSFHGDLNAQKLKISAVPAVSSMLYKHSEAARDITHTVALVHKDIHTHLSMQPSKLSHTSAHRHT